jgi:hypothetical protein
MSAVGYEIVPGIATFDPFNLNDLEVPLDLTRNFYNQAPVSDAILSSQVG